MARPSTEVVALAPTEEIQDRPPIGLEAVLLKQIRNLVKLK